jgi:carbamoyltransferase
VYRALGIKLGFDAIGPEGKLMGLSSYGKPRFFDSRFVGNVHDSQQRFGEGPFSAWYKHCLKRAEQDHYAMEHGDASQVLDPISVDMAASTQKLFEEGYLLAAEILQEGLAKAGHGTGQLCLSGGAALNCPSNSRLYNESAFRDIYIDPNCDDGGLSVGGALYIYHNLLDRPVDGATCKANQSPFYGLRWPDDLSEQIFVEAARQYSVSKPENIAARAAQDLAENKVLALFEGRSEMGPRALCHRSVLANPTDHDNWARVNGIKGREAWRPFAPVVMEEKMQDWFAECPTHSPYMLFTARVKSRRLPAITHVDGSSRIQTTSAETGTIHQILREFDALTGIPVLMNTSLNGPGVPIVERPDEAYALFKDSAVDVLYLNGTRISKE